MGSEIVADGPWTGYDIAKVDDIEVSNGIVTGTGDKARMIESAKMRSGDMSDYETQANVIMVDGFITQTKWDEYFPSIKHTNICTGSKYNRTGFLKAVAKFPKFCGENGGRASLPWKPAREKLPRYSHILLRKRAKIHSGP